jgi:opacity protein-like surface antigen
MKKILLLLAVSAATFTAAAQSGSAIDSTQLNVPILTFETETIDYGTIEYGSDGNREFKFRNTGKEPLIITNVIKGCGCTTPTLPKEPVKPGETAVLKVHYDTKRVGAFDKVLTVESNSITPQKVIHIKGNVLPKKEEEKFPGGK